MVSGAGSFSGMWTMSDPLVQKPSGLYRPQALLSGHRGVDDVDPLIGQLKYVWTCNENGTLTDSISGKHLTARNSPTRFWHSADLQYGQQYNTGAICHYNSSAPAWGSSNGSFALGLWIRSDQAPSVNDHYFFCVENNNGEIIAVRHYISVNRFLVVLNDSPPSGGVIVTANVLGAPSIGTWYYLLMQYVTDTSLTLYVNNVSQGGTAASGGYINGRVVFGARKFDGTQSKPVSVDAVHFWQDYVLSADERTYMWNSGNGRELV